MIDWELFVLIYGAISSVFILFILYLLFRAFKKIDEIRTECMKLRARMNRNILEPQAPIKKIRSSEPPSKKISFDLEQIGIDINEGV